MAWREFPREEAVHKKEGSEALSKEITLGSRFEIEFKLKAALKNSNFP